MAKLTRQQASRTSSLTKALAALGAVVVLALGASSASAHPVEHLVYDGSINGSDATGVSSSSFIPSFNPESGLNQLAMDQESRTLYAASGQGGGRIYKFDGVTRLSDPFSALVKPTPEPNASVITPQQVNGLGGLTVDNTDGPSQGRIYTFPEFGPVSAFEPTGAIGSFPIVVNGDICGATVGPEGHLWIAKYETGIIEFLPTGAATGVVFHPSSLEMCNFDMDSQGNFYVPTNYLGGLLKKYDSDGTFQYSLGNGQTRVFTVNRSDDSIYLVEGGKISRYASDGSPIDKFGLAEPGYAGLPLAAPGSYSAAGIAVDENTNEVFVANHQVGKIDVFVPGPPNIGADVTTGTAVPGPTSATLHGTVNPDGVDTSDCYFEWGASTSYGHTLDCAEGDVFSGSLDHEVSAEIPPDELTFGAVYHVRLVVENSSAGIVFGADRTFTAQDKPIVKRLFVDGVNTDGTVLSAEVDPNQGSTKYHFEYGIDTNYGNIVPATDASLASSATVETVKQQVHDLTPGTEYLYRIVASNAAGSTEATGAFSTFPRNVVDSSCENNLSRQQTGAALLPDCRSYELASATDTGGYNVESDLVPGEEPFDGYPNATDRLLYGVHDGGIPGTGSPTNHGLDPYLASRGEDGWSTKYVGVPANGTPSAAPFSSPLLGANEGLQSFAFGGPNICDPCFADGSSGIPLRDSQGALSQGMAGDLEPTSPSRDGLVRKAMSADGTHLIFGSTSAFEDDGNDETGDVSIYDRDLTTGETQVVSKNPSGDNLVCMQGAGTCHSPGNANGIASLDVSEDGSRIVVAQKLATDSAGNEYWHPYMHIGSDPNTIDLAPGTTRGVLFDGMTSDGSKVFFTTRDKLVPEDTDSSADIYLVEVDDTGPITPELISVNGSGPSNADDCEPLTDWNTVSGGPNCDAVAFAGGAGLASEEGTFYFISPELLDGSNGEEDLVNLYVVKPGQDPHFVAVMDSDVGKPPPPPPARPVINPDFLTGLNTLEALAVDQSNGDIYVGERASGTVSRFKSNGEPHNFTAGPDAGTNEIPGFNFGSGQLQIAVDNHSGSAFENAFYVAAHEDLSLFADTGELLGSIDIASDCGVAVDQSSGVVYVGSFTEGIWRLEPISSSLPITKADYVATRIETGQSFRPCQVGADSIGHVFAANLNDGGPLKSFEASSFSASPTLVEGTLVSTAANTMATDPSTNELFVNTGGRIDVYGPLGDFKEEIAKGAIAGSHGVAVNGTNHHVYAVNGSRVVELGYVESPPQPINNPAVVHAVNQGGIHDSGDFQVSPDGHFAAFGSGAPITDFDPFGHLEVYRYDAQADVIDCASCAPTNAQATSDASLPHHGNGLTEGGRVFFNSREPLVLRDTNGSGDPYEWSEGKVYLLSSGMSPFDSGLLSVSASGRDAYFFTREKLAPEDQNASLMRIYDAREGGGFFHIPDPPPCAASDECHGPSSQAAAPPSIGSLAATAGNAVAGKPSCKRGFARKRGGCVRKHHRRRPVRHQGRGANR